MHLRLYQKKKKKIKKAAVAIGEKIVDKTADKKTGRISPDKAKNSKTVAGCVTELSKELEFRVKRLIKTPKKINKHHQKKNCKLLTYVD